MRYTFIELKHRRIQARITQLDFNFQDLVAMSLFAAVSPFTEEILWLEIPVHVAHIVHAVHSPRGLH